MNVHDLATALNRRTAAALGVQKLYRFQKYDPTKIALLLTKGLIRVSDPRFFNDPFDCRPFFSGKAIESPEGLEGFAAYFRGALKNNPTALAALEAELPRLRESAEHRASSMRGMSRAALEHISRTNRILCCGTEHLSPLLWAHYADGHRGISIEFDASRPPFSAALQVTYLDAYPQLDFVSGNADQLAQIALLAKSDCWAYEKEFRLITSEVDGTIYPRSRVGFLEIPKEAIAAITLGQAAKPAQAEELRQLLAQHAPGTKLRWAIRNTGSYALQFGTLPLDRPVHEVVPGVKPAG